MKEFLVGILTTVVGVVIVDGSKKLYLNWTHNRWKPAEGDRVFSKPDNRYLTICNVYEHNMYRVTAATAPSKSSAIIEFRVERHKDDLVYMCKSDTWTAPGVA